MSTRGLIAAGAAALLAVTLAPLPAAASPAATAAAPSAAPPAAPAESGTYENPITDGFSDTYADPVIIRGRDGWWYLYATSDPLVEGGEFGIMHQARSRDMVEWEYLGTVFDEDDVPAWAAEGSLFWAPDVRRIGEEYVMYFTVTDTAANEGQDFAIGMASAPTAAGPWTPTDAPVVEPSRVPGTGGDGTWANTIDPALLATEDGRLFLYYGGFNGGVSVVELDETGREAVGEPTLVGSMDRYEGAYVTERDGYYYLQLSSAACCNGPTAGYSVFVGRSTDPRGPFVDREGVRLDVSRAGGTQVLQQNGNEWVGIGHHAVVTDLAGQDWIVYHGIDTADPWLNEPGGINRRPTLIDRLDWVDGWPVVNAGAGPSSGETAAPVTAGSLGISADSPASDRGIRALSGSWTVGEDATADAGETGVLAPGRLGVAAAVSRGKVRGDARVEADVRLGPGARLGCAGLGTGITSGVTACLDAKRHELVLRSGTRIVDRAEVPARLSLEEWLSLSVEVRDGRVTAEVSESRLGNPAAQVSGKARGGSGALVLGSWGGALEVDNVSVAPAAALVSKVVPDPRVGKATFTESFDRPGPASALGRGWELVNPDDSVEVTDGALRWPLGADDLSSGEDDTSTLLLRDAPDGDWAMETSFTLDLGEDTVRNFQQAGLVVHVDDDDFLRLGQVALGTSRVVEWFVERPGAPAADGTPRLDRGSWIGGPTASTMHLRILKTTGSDGLQNYRAASSTDGKHWRWGAVWTLPADAEPRIGLYAGGGAAPAVTADFERFAVRVVKSDARAGASEE
ncbi:family 43 glycosylhydrolase [Homoserinibacter sp. YIM 151385]|uniref:family 43 glycosylhydrolase n=1 Tax=Homoserinibacter sp. YIM 151385 TaxID=2985506 RepID=UPI0022F00C53|nr:family 43 glycosylhydrolase [Homoserinibacter sp. YIM 151385]WBU39117.1 family 43 glycosylhydrolase [Homoserinibacter sp. YIM 151385]